MNTPRRVLTLASLATVAAVPFAAPAAASNSASANAASSASTCRDARLVPSHDNLARIRAATLCLLNVERTSRGLTKLRASAPLRQAATSFSRMMVRKRFFGHNDPSGSTMLSRIKRTSYINRSVRTWSLGENIGWGCGSYATPQSMVSMWMDSSGHRQNILNKRFRHVGIGVVAGAPEKFEGVDPATYTTDFGYRILT